MSTEDSDSEFEEHLVYIDFSNATFKGVDFRNIDRKLEALVQASQQNLLSLDVASLSSSTLKCNIDSEMLTGQHEINLGSQAFFAVSNELLDKDKTNGTFVKSEYQKSNQPTIPDGKYVQFMGITLQKASMRQTSINIHNTADAKNTDFSSAIPAALQNKEENVTRVSSKRSRHN